MTVYKITERQNVVKQSAVFVFFLSILAIVGQEMVARLRVGIFRNEDPVNTEVFTGCGIYYCCMNGICRYFLNFDATSYTFS